MPEVFPTWAIDLFKYVGFPALIFIIWYVSHRSNQKQQESFLTVITAERTQWLEEIRSSSERMMATYADQMSRQNATTLKLVDAVAQQNAQLAEMKGATRSNGKSIDDLRDEIRTRRIAS
jgi:hypothetical protein